MLCSAIMPKRPLSVRPPPDSHRPKNKLLAALPRADFQRLQLHLKTVPIAVRQVLHRRNESIRDVFFLNGGVASITTVMNDGAMVEIATVGDEGLLGIGVLLGGDSMPGETMMQVSDASAEVMSIDTFRHEIARRGALHDSAQGSPKNCRLGDSLETPSRVALVQPLPPGRTPTACTSRL